MVYSSVIYVVKLWHIEILIFSSVTVTMA